MEYKRVLTVQDLSCLGQCSGSVALTTLAAFGYEACLLPTALLSAHTAFRGPYVCQLTDSIGPIAGHWKREGIRFDAILTGYLGAAEDIAPVLGLIDDLLVPGGVCVVDPAMADSGKFYSGLNEAYGDAMRGLCARADVLLPNRTEAAFLTGLPESAPASALLEALPQKNAILTGSISTPEETGFAVKEGETIREYRQRKVPGRYFGTGDLFVAVLTGKLLRGASLRDAACMAGEFTSEAVKLTYETDKRSYGLKYEPLLHRLGGSL